MYCTTVHQRLDYHLLFHHHLKPDRSFPAYVLLMLSSQASFDDVLELLTTITIIAWWICIPECLSYTRSNCGFLLTMCESL